MKASGDTSPADARSEETQTDEQRERERRREERVPLHVEVRFEERSQAARALRAFTTNVSVGGLCVRTQHVYPVGHRLSLTLSVEGRTLRLQAMVAWTRGDAVGLRFVEVGEEDRALLRGLMASAQRATSSSGQR